MIHWYSHRTASRMGALVTVALLLAFLIGPAAIQAQRPTSIIFLHHSTGENLINQGGVREGLTARGYEFWDHGYNGDGLRGPDGSSTGRNFDVPDDNTDPDGFAAIFSQPLHNPPDNTFSYLMQYDVIAFKSCFPTSNIGDDDQLNQYKAYYHTIRNRMDQFPDKVFIVLTPPPQVPGASNPAEATRARAFANWLKSDEYLAGHPNVFTFDFFDLLAGADNFLRPEYRDSNDDAHPNVRANQTIGPIFVDFIDQAIRGFQGGAPRPTAAVQPTTAPVEPTAAPPGSGPAAGAPAAGVIEDFEQGLDYWSANVDGAGTEVDLELDSQVTHSGQGAMRVQYTVAAGGWGGCDRYFDSRQDWSGTAGLSLWLRANPAGQSFLFMVFAGDPENPTGFETRVQAPPDWSQVTIPWSSLQRASWADASGLAQFDPAQVTSIAIILDENTQGTLWIDDIGLLGSGGQPPVPAPTVPVTTSAPGVQPTSAPTTPGQPTGGR
ncbi:MAG: CIA30 family protein, partial [Chloroflexi bacterium]|nr:CIA30 family protein [Chloroflexota bacterium]